MKTTIKACSFDEAYELLLEENSKLIDYKVIDLNGLLSEDPVGLEGLEYLGILFFYRSELPGENINKTQTKVIDKPGKGTKKWETKYLIVDRFNNLLIKDTNYKFKKEAVDAAREYTNKYFTSSFVILGKSLEGSDRIQAEIHYKPSLDQKDGSWTFIF